MSLHPLAGLPPAPENLVNLHALRQAYLARDLPFAPVAFGTSGHRGTSLEGSFNECHVLAITQAVCEYRSAQGISGPLFIGFDSHALSELAFRSAITVLIANGVKVHYQKDLLLTPTPAISHAILCHNSDSSRPRADGIVITPSHNPPQDGGFKYNGPDGGPASTEVTSWVERRANELIGDGLVGVLSLPYQAAIDQATAHDFIAAYVAELDQVIDMAAIAKAGLRIGVDPLGGTSLPYWDPIAKRYGLDITVVNRSLDPTFSFMCCDKDGAIRMDCSSPYAMTGLIGLRDSFDIACGNDPDADRHGIVTRSSGLLNPNHFLAVAIWYLYTHRPQWPAQALIGKTLVSSAMIDKVAAMIGRQVQEVPVGFKWFVDGLATGQLAFGGEESAGASFLRRDGSPWSTDKDGIILCLLAAEILAVTGKDPGQIYAELEQRFGRSCYKRVDAPASPAQKNRLKKLSASDISATSAAGEPITSKLSHAPGNGAPIGGVKITTASGWFAARPSGTEDVYKIYAESFRDAAHLDALIKDAQAIVDAALKS